MLQHQIRDIFLSRKYEVFIKRRVHFTFCSCPSMYRAFHGLQDSTSPFGCQFDRAPILKQYFGRFRLQHSSSDFNGCFSGNCTANYSKIMQNLFDFCSQFLGDHTRTSRTFKSDFLSRCCFFIYILSAIQIAPITKRLSFEFITNLCSGQRPIYELLVSRVCCHKTQPLVLYPQERLASFSLSLFVASMRSVLSQHTPWYWTLYRLMSAMLRQIGTHCQQFFAKIQHFLFLPQIVEVQNELIFSVFLSFVLFECFYKYIILIWVGGNFIPPCWFSLNNSETVKAVTLAFCSIQEHFIRNIRAKFGISNSPQSPDIGQNSNGGIFDFRISGQSLIKENFYNSN